MTQEQLMNLHPVTWIDGENMCRWKGMHSDEYTKLIGVEELTEDEENCCIIGDVMFVKLGTRVSTGEGIYEIRSYDDLQSINIEMLREFTKDLEDYYDRQVSHRWDDLAPKEFLINN